MNLLNKREFIQIIKSLTGIGGQSGLKKVQQLLYVIAALFILY